jgi:hypothetical protein
MTKHAVTQETWPIEVWAPGSCALRKVTTSETRLKCCGRISLKLFECELWQRDQGRQVNHRDPETSPPTPLVGRRTRKTVTSLINLPLACSTGH